jgi:hypothetical protein
MMEEVLYAQLNNNKERDAVGAHETAAAAAA